MSLEVPYRTKSAAGAYRAPLLALCVLAVTFYLAVKSEAHGPACFFRWSTGIPCPGCGITRSLSNVWRGNFLLSIRYHPFGLPLFVLCCCTLLFFFSDRWFPRLTPYTDRLRAWFMQSATLISIAVAMIGIWILRLGLDKMGMHFFIW